MTTDFDAMTTIEKVAWHADQASASAYMANDMCELGYTGEAQIMHSAAQTHAAAAQALALTLHTCPNQPKTGPRSDEQPEPVHWVGSGSESASESRTANVGQS